MLLVLAAAVMMWGIDTERRPLDAVALEPTAEAAGEFAKTGELT